MMFAQGEDRMREAELSALQGQLAMDDRAREAPYDANMSSVRTPHTLDSMRVLTLQLVVALIV